MSVCAKTKLFVRSFIFNLNLHSVRERFSYPEHPMLVWHFPPKLHRMVTIFIVTYKQKREPQLLEYGVVPLWLRTICVEESMCRITG